MLRILPEGRAKDLLLSRIRELEDEGRLDRKKGLMLGCLVSRTKGGEETVSFAFSGAWNGKYIVPSFVPPCFSNSAFEDIVSRYDSAIHCYSDRIERGESALEATRRALSNECLDEIRKLYTFHSPIGKVHLADLDLPSMPTGLGDCATIKLLNNCFRRGWQPLELSELYYGDDSPKHCHLESCTPCDERCKPLMKYIFSLDLLYSDHSIALINKEEGMLSVPGRGEDKEDSVASRFRKIFPSCPQNPSVHRLDMDTSGILVLAKTREAHRKLSMQFEARETEKSYVALVEGLVRDDCGMIDLPIRLDVDRRPYQIVDHENGKKAVTRWQRIRVEILDGRQVTRIRFTPLTGRTHQIRVHAASGLGHPIVGDRLYGTRKEGERLCLHAESLSFDHPESGERVTFSSPCPF